MCHLFFSSLIAPHKATTIFISEWRTRPTLAYFWCVFLQSVGFHLSDVLCRLIWRDCCLTRCSVFFFKHALITTKRKILTKIGLYYFFKGSYSRHLFMKNLCTDGLYVSTIWMKLFFSLREKSGIYKYANIFHFKSADGRRVICLERHMQKTFFISKKPRISLLSVSLWPTSKHASWKSYGIDC